MIAKIAAVVFNICLLILLAFAVVYFTWVYLIPWIISP